MRQMLTSVRFMFLWVIGGVFALFASVVSSVIIFTGGGVFTMILWTSRNREPNFTEAVIIAAIVYSLIGLFFGLAIGSVQKALLRQKTDESWNGWLVMSALGGIIGADILAFLLIQQVGGVINSLTVPPVEMLWLVGIQVAVIPLACISFMQMGVLNQYVTGAWTWILANITAGLALFALFASGVVVTAGTFLFGLLSVVAVATAPPIVTGFAMLWLINLNWKHDYPEF